MVSLASDFQVMPINQQSEKIEEEYYKNLFIKASDSLVMFEIYVQQIPNVRIEPKVKPMSNRMAKLRKAGLIGCLNDTDVTSKNYKEIIYGSVAADSSTQ